MTLFLPIFLFGSVMGDSEQLQLLMKQKSKLEKAIQADLKWLAGELHSIGFLNDQECDDIRAPRSMISNTDNSGVIVSALQRRVKLEPTDLEKFVRILEKKPLLFKPAIKLLDSGKQTSDA